MKSLARVNVCAGAPALVFEKDAPIEPGDAIPAAERKGPIDLAPEKLEHPENAVLAGAGDAPEVRAADQHGARAKRQRLDDVDAAPEAAVDKHRRLARRPPRQCREARGSRRRRRRAGVRHDWRR